MNRCISSVPHTSVQAEQALRGMLDPRAYRDLTERHARLVAYLQTKKRADSAVSPRGNTERAD